LCIVSALLSTASALPIVCRLSLSWCCGCLDSVSQLLAIGWLAQRALLAPLGNTAKALEKNSRRSRLPEHSHQMKRNELQLFLQSWEYLVRYEKS
jgi:hypothetical protein